MHDVRGLDLIDQLAGHDWLLKPEKRHQGAGEIDRFFEQT